MLPGSAGKAHMSTTLFSSLPTLPAGTVVSALVSIQMKNLDALAAAQKAAMDGLGSLAKQQQDMLSAKLKDATSLPATLIGSDPRAAIAKPFDAVKSAILDGTAQANLLSELAAQSGANVASILQNRLVASLDELKAALLGAARAAPRPCPPGDLPGRCRREPGSPPAGGPRPP